MSRPDIPCDTKTEPAFKIVLNAPCCFDQKTAFRFTNLGFKKIGWQLKANNLDRYGVDPVNGVLKPQENVLINVKCRPFFFKSIECIDDRLTIEWVDIPEENRGESSFNVAWFSKAPVVRRLILPFRYNS